MELKLDPSLVTDYKSRSQMARVMSEAWFEEFGYCPACTCDDLDRLQNNAVVIDFQCPHCEETYQLKSKGGNFGGIVANSEYNQKIEKIRSGQVPNYAFMSYDPKDLTIRSISILPKHFITFGIIQKRKPLSETARRKGWIGSNILLKDLPLDAMLYLVRDCITIDPNKVRQMWSKYVFLEDIDLRNRGWTIDVLHCVKDLKKEVFTLQEVYSYQEKLQGIHPGNHHVRDKIRQQLQVLRDNGILSFEERGIYRMI
jgi:type II restriction enzyme